MSKSNILWKSLQSFLGFALISVQSQFLSKEDLAAFAIAQSLVVIISLFDFGFGVRITNDIVDKIHTSDSAIVSSRFAGISVLLAHKLQIVLLSFFQSVIFLAIFYLLLRGINRPTDLTIYLVFMITVLLNSIGNFYGKLFTALGEINYLVKLQGIGALIGFGVGTVGSFSKLNLHLSIFSLCLSSIFLGALALMNSRIGDKNRLSDDLLSMSTQKFHRPATNVIVQFSQVSQVMQPVFVQYFILEIFGASVLISFLVCQRLFNSIANIFGTDLQFNQSLRNQEKKIGFEDILRFKAHILGFFFAGLFASVSCFILWDIIFSKISKPGAFDLLSFAVVGVAALVDQSVRFRMYGLKDFVRETLGNVIFFITLIVFSLIIPFNHLYQFNLVLVLVYIFKFVFLFKASKYRLT